MKLKLISALLSFAVVTPVMIPAEALAQRHNDHG
jgi:hypothetical protein